MADQLLTITVELAGTKREEVFVAIDVKHTIKGCPFEATSGSINGSQRGNTVEGDLAGSDPDNWAILSVQLENSMD
jgi:hypothetical protein